MNSSELIVTNNKLNTISIIAAFSHDNVIGYRGKLPWRLPPDLQRFKKITMGHPIIMGRITWQSINFPLPGRTSIIISKNENLHINYKELRANDLESAIKLAKSCLGSEEIFIIGGESIYKEAINLADKLYITRINHDFIGDKRFPKFSKQEWMLTNIVKMDYQGISFNFENYQKKMS